MPASEWQEEQSRWTQEERELADHLRLAPAQRTPQCLSDDVLLEYLANPQKHPNASSNVQHIASCLYCAQRLKTAREAYADAAALATPMLPPPAPENRSRATVPRWFAVAAFACAVCALLLMWWGTLPTRQTPRAVALAPLLAASERQQQQIAALQQQLNSKSNSKSNSGAKPPPEQGQTRPSPREQELAAQLAALQKANAALQTAMQTETRVSHTKAEALRNVVSRADVQIKQLRQQIADQKRPASGSQVAYNLPEDVRSLRSRVSDVRGNPDPAKPTVTLLYPLGERVLETRPTFRWQPMEGATSYSVWIYDVTSHDPLSIDHADNLNVAEWQANVPLVPGKVYEWQVMAVRPDGPVSAPRPEFRVATPAEAAQLHFDLGVQYARNGLLSQAEDELRKVAEKTPVFTQAQQWLKRLRAPQPH